MCPRHHVPPCGRQGSELSGPVDYRHAFLDMTDISVAASEWTREGRTCPAAMGNSFAAGTTDGGAGAGGGGGAAGGLCARGQGAAGPAALRVGRSAWRGFPSIACIIPHAQLHLQLQVQVHPPDPRTPDSCVSP